MNCNNLIKLLTILTLVSFCSIAQARDWDDHEIKLGVLVTTAYILDWKTTRDMTKRYDEGYQEAGFVVKSLFGSKPSTEQIDLYFSVLVPAALFTAHSFPEYRKIILTTSIVFETLAAFNNRRIGLSFRF